jgi:hypothetical protein
LSEPFSESLNDAELAALAASVSADGTDVLTVATDTRSPIGMSWAFDFLSNRFQTFKNKGPLETHDIQTLYGWMEKCLRTDRGAHPVHPPGYGMVRPFDMIGLPVAQAIGSDLEARITDALLFHPRIAAVRDFSFEIDPDDDLILAEFTVILDDEAELPVQVALP